MVKKFVELPLQVITTKGLSELNLSQVCMLYISGVNSRSSGKWKPDGTKGECGTQTQLTQLEQDDSNQSTATQAV